MTHKIAICIATYNRNEDLGRLLKGLARLKFVKNPSPLLVVYVVDNTPDGSAAVVCEASKSGMPWELRYFIEKARGITYVRNRLVGEVNSSADLIAFIDDDEVPDENWLDELLDVFTRFDADVVAGPVYRKFSEKVEGWVEHPDLYKRPDYITGDDVKLVGAGNVLMKADIFNQYSFDNRLALVGGEDMLLFLQLHHDGYKMKWCQEAVAWEHYPPERATVKWLLQRAFRSASCNVYAFSKVENLGKAVWVKRGVREIVLGVISFLAHCARGKVPRIKAMVKILYGVGLLAGVIGYRFREYK